MAKEEKLFYHECRAAGIVFKTADEWMDWLAKNGGNIRKPIAEHEGFQYNVNDVCLNPRISASYKMDDYHHYEVRTAKTQYGWTWGYNITLASSGSSAPASYPSRYDNTAIFYETEGQAAQDALSFIIRQLEGKPKTKATSMMLFYAKKQRADIVHPQTELFPTGEEVQR